MECKNHPGVEAAARCTGCQEAFCDNCLVDMSGAKYCGSCKVMAVKEAPVIEESNLPCQEANDALKYAIIGIFCFGIILEPIAISKAVKAKRMIAENPRLEGNGKATAAIIIGIVTLILWIIGMIARVSEY
jgi:hypothetical protein